MRSSVGQDITIVEIVGITITGEGALMGRPTVMVRTGGCDYGCRWCDSLYAVDTVSQPSWFSLATREVFAAIQELSPAPILVTLTGGNPALQPLGDLLHIGHEHGYTFCMETQGSVARPWMSQLDFLTVSPKPPSSGMATNWTRLGQVIDVASSGKHRCILCLKIVVFDDCDYAFAREVHRRYPKVPLYLQPGNATPAQAGSFDLEGLLERTRWLMLKVTHDGWSKATVLPQLHTLLWGNMRGV